MRKITIDKIIEARNKAQLSERNATKNLDKAIAEEDYMRANEFQGQQLLHGMYAAEFNNLLDL